MTVRGWVAALCAVAVALSATAACSPAEGATKKRRAISQRSVPQGTAVRLSMLRADRRYRETVLREFDSLTPENELKMAALQPRRGEYRFETADELVRFAWRNGKFVRGHTLVWNLGLPLWLFDHGVTESLGLRLPVIDLPPLPLPRDLVQALGGAATLLTDWTREELLAVMRDHITTVMRHFGTRIRVWDVVNEPLTPFGSHVDSVWQRFIGHDYIEQALRTARAASPRARLFVNEYGVERPGPKQDGLYALVKDLVDRGVPLDGVGLQSHSHILGYVDEATMRQTMRRFEALGLEVQVTEMDVGTSALGIALVDRLTRQAAAYGAAARACNAVKACTSFTTWGFTDAVSWLGVGESSLLFDSRYEPKPAFGAVRAAFAPRSRYERPRAGARRG